MPTTFPPEFIARIGRRLEKGAGRPVSEEETIRYLDAMADLGLLMHKVCEMERRLRKKQEMGWKK